MGVRRAVFLDRDGTLHRELERAPRDPSAIELYDGALEAVRELDQAGWVVVVITNQSAIANGDVAWDELESIHAFLRARAPIAGFFVCPHHPERGAAPYRRTCACRKPGHGLLSFAARELDLDPRRSWIVGDARRDVEAGLALGTRAVLVETGKGLRERAAATPELLSKIECTRDVRAAADLILAGTVTSRPPII